MEVVFRKLNYNLEFSEKQLYELFSYLISCHSYESGVLGFSKSKGLDDIIPDVWTPECARKAESYTISDKMMKIIDEKKNSGFQIHHFHSHLSDLPFPSVDDPYNIFESMGIVSLGNPEYADFRVFKQLDYCSYPPSLANISSGGKMSAIVRFYKNDGRIEFLPIEEKVKINVADAPFYRDW